MLVATWSSIVDHANDCGAYVAIVAPIVACISKQNGISIEFTKGQARKLY